jgi:hypothetical protein
LNAKATHDRYGNPTSPASESRERLFLNLPEQRQHGVQDLAQYDYEQVQKALVELNNCPVRDGPLILAPQDLEKLVSSRSLSAIPFLVTHVSTQRLRGQIIFSTGDYMLLTHPYLETLIRQYGDAGVGAILDYLAKRDAEKPTDEELRLFAYGILSHCGFDDIGRKFAADWINLTERRQRRTGALDRLRKELVHTERTYR